MKGAVIVQNRAKRGLFDGVHIASGNNVSHSNAKTRRTFKPNIQDKSYYSPLLQRYIRTEVTTRAMRSIDKCGGIDEYILQLKGNERKGTILAQQLFEEMTSIKKLQKQQQQQSPQNITIQNENDNSNNDAASRSIPIVTQSAVI